MKPRFYSCLMRQVDTSMNTFQNSAIQVGRWCCGHKEVSCPENLSWTFKAGWNFTSRCRMRHGKIILGKRAAGTNTWPCEKVRLCCVRVRKSLSWRRTHSGAGLNTGQQLHKWARFGRGQVGGLGALKERDHQKLLSRGSENFMKGAVGVELCLIQYWWH